MSAHKHEADPVAEDDHDHHEAFDAEPARELAADESPSPMWLPVLGVALFIGVGLFWSLSTDADAADKGAQAAGSASATAAAAAPPTPTPQLPAAVRPGAARPGANPVAPGQPGVRAPTKADMDRVKQLLRQKREAAGLKPPQPGAPKAPAPAPR